MPETGRSTDQAARGGAIAPGEHFDEIVVGAGIAGLATALLLARAGRRVAVLDAASIGEGTTGRGGGVVSALQGVRLGEVRERNTTAVTAAYAASQLAAVAWLRDFAASSGLGLTERDAVTFAVGDRGAARVNDELVLARALGIEAQPIRDAGLPWQTSAAIRLPGQLHVDPVTLLSALAGAVRAAGGRIVEHTRVDEVRGTNPARVGTLRGEFTAERVVIATGAPILDRGLYFAKLAPRRSYLVESRVAGGPDVPTAMATGVDSPLRTVRAVDGLLTTGGGVHGVGRAPSTIAVADRLAEETARWWPHAEHLAVSSSQDYATPHRVPFVGWLPRGHGRIYLATGFGDWGLTNGISSALTLAADLLGGGEDWMRVLHRRPTLGTAIATGIGEGAAVAQWYLRGWLGALSRPAPTAPPEGAGGVGRIGLLPAAVATVDGETSSVCAICPHLGAIVGWNDLEQTWDCPAHGSRFRADGAPIEGPAKWGLAPL